MSNPSAQSSDADRQPVAEPTKYILLCCELRKRREGRAASVGRPRVRVNPET